ncbi:ATP-grasp domain-containing protein [Rosenbergiella epipactidis]|uniref:ATP-grasp domain-containing protein n=1 Tax=Rosenbergiella epipactidis TaxID=1544694 RepID=UPI001F4D3CDB|nr:ATP-grasp domain-containing protein [Rosenbergiella epipactidis]
MGSRVIMLGGWTDIYEKVKKYGFELTVVQEKGDIKLKDIEIVDHIVSYPMNHPMVPEIVLAMHKGNPFDIVLSFQELGQMNAARIGELLGIACNPMAPVSLVCNKAKMRQHMQRHVLPSIPYLVASNPEAVARFGHEYGWPIILKPIDGAGSKQIHKLGPDSDIDTAFASILADFPGESPIAEKFISGPEVSVEAISWGGEHTILAVTDKMTTGAPYFVEVGHNMPSALASDTIAEIKMLTDTFLKSIGHLHGPSHTEIIVSENGPIIIESHTRTGGDRIFEMVELVCGIDLFGATLQGYKGEFPTLENVQNCAAAIRFLTLPEGRVASISGLDEASKAPGVVRCDIDVKIGSLIKPFRDSDERHGYILATGNCGRSAIKNVENAIGKIIVEMSGT